MAAVVATMVVGPLVKIVMEKASSSLLHQYKVMKGMEEQHEILKRRLLVILDIITEAEQAAADSGQAAARRAGVIAWLEAIKKVAYQGDEVFDEFKYEALRRKAKKEGHYNDLGFHLVKLFPTHNRFIFRQRMGKKLLKVLRAIEHLVKEMNDFGFQNQQQQPVSYQWRLTDHDLFDPKKIINRSRAKDNKNIIDILVSQSTNADLTVVPIVGMGGLGKTTLAQLVYNDPETQKHFDMLIWVCVSNSFDVDSLAKSIVDAAPKKVDDGTQAAASKKNDGTEAVASKKKNDGTEAVASKMKDDGTEAAAAKKMTPLDSLQNVVRGQRYLLVLDDVWTREDDKWEQLKARLEHGGVGSVVLTTTRDKVVAEIMGTVEAYNLGALGRQYLKEIIETKAFSRLKKEEEKSAVLVNMVDEIVERCAGSPLAAIALGSILRNKTSEEEWKVVSSRSEESGILPILKLSYNDLPAHMKQCFALCAIFPKDYKIDVDKLIQLWIAHGFIIEEKHVRLETTGKHIFSELVSRSFFQDVKQVHATVRDYHLTTVRYSTTCKMHDLMHDVALSVMEKECVSATAESEKIDFDMATEKPSQSEWLPNTARHLFLSCEKPEIKLNSALEKSSPVIQTLMCDSYIESSSLQHLSKYGSLQALQLCLGRSSFPLKPKHLHHLRYLDLSGSHIKTLPEDMSILYNLETLNLYHCMSLRQLPRQMKYLTALRHLYTHGCYDLENMPRDLGKLTSLQTLTCFVAGSGSNCSNVGELGNLNLGDQLELRELQYVTKEDAKAANLMKKKELRDLTLRWDPGWNDTYITSRGPGWDDYTQEVIKNLKPHDGLHAIRIYRYRGTNFPLWMAMLQNIVEIHLFDCRNLRLLFNHDHDTSLAFPNLKEVTLDGLVDLERWWKIDNGVEGEEILFPRLEKLHISFCMKLEALPGHPTFPNLQNVRINGCPRLTTTAKSPKLCVLHAEGYEAELFLWVARHMASLTHLELISCDQNYQYTSVLPSEHSLREVLDSKEKLNDHDFPLEVLVLKDFKSNVTDLCACFVHLQELSILHSDALVHWPEKEFQALVSLRRLLIERCNLIGYAEAPAEPSTSSESRQLLPRLESLTIKQCPSLLEVFNVPASLRKMDIECCWKLKSINGRRVQQGQSASSIHQGPSSVPEVSSPSLPGSLAEHLEELTLWDCYVRGVLHLPPSLRELHIHQCGLTSLESRSGELPLLKRLQLSYCQNLSSLPDGPQAYSSLQDLCIEGCPSLKTLPSNLQQRLGSIQKEYVDPHYYGIPAAKRRPIPTPLKPKTWKYAICRD